MADYQKPMEQRDSETEGTKVSQSLQHELTDGVKLPHTLQWNLRIKDTLGQGVLSFIERFPLLKCTGIIGIGTSRFVFYREVFFICSVLYQMFHCIVLCLLSLQCSVILRRKRCVP